MTDKIKSFSKATSWTVRLLILGVIALIGAALSINPDQAFASTDQEAQHSTSSISVVAQTGGSDPVPVSSEQPNITAAPSSANIGTQPVSVPTEIGDTSDLTYRGSPAYFADRSATLSSDFTACEYLTFCRWRTVSEMPTPSVGFSSMGQLLPAMSAGISSMVFSVAGMIMFLFGVVLIFIMSVELVTSGIYVADYMFASLTTNFLGLTTSSPGLLVAYVLILGVLLAAVAIAVPSRIKTRFDWGLRSVGILVLAIGALILMSIQSAKNHEGIGPDENLSDIATMTQGGASDRGSLAASPESGDAGNPSNWAFLSLGWLVSQANQIGNDVGGVVTDTSNRLSNAIDDGYGGPNTNTCQQYIYAMHAVYNNTASAENLGGNSSVLIAYDELMGRMYFQNYQLASLGETRSASNAWCRMAENQSGVHPGDQLMIGRVGGLYQAMAGAGGLGIIDGDAVVNPDAPYSPDAALDFDTSGSWSFEDGELSSFVNEEGHWVSEGTQVMAGNVMGPNFRSSAAARQASIFWATCEWRGPVQDDDGEWSRADPRVNPEWSGVLQAQRDEPIGSGSCTDWGIIGAPNVTADRDDEGNITGYSVDGQIDWPIFGTSESPEDWGFGSDHAEEIWQFEEEEEWAIVGPMFGWGGSEMADRFTGGEADGVVQSQQAYTYYLNTQGEGTTAGLMLSVIGLTLILMTVKYFAPIAIGAMLSQVVGLTILMIFGILLLLLVIPLQVTRRIFMTIGVKMLLATMIVTALITALMAVVFNLAKLITAILGNSVNWGAGDSLMGALISGIGAWLAFWAMKVLVSQTTGFKLGTIRGGIQTGIAATSPALQDMGFDAVSPLSRDFWGNPVRRFRKDERSTDPSMRTDTGVVTEASTRDDRDLLRDQNATSAGLKDRAEQRKKNREAQAEDLALKKDNLDRGKSDIGLGDPDKLRDGRDRRTNEPNRAYQAAGIMRAGAAIPGKHSPFLLAGSKVAGALGTGIQFGRKAMDLKDQGLYQGKRGLEHAKYAASAGMHHAGKIGDKARDIGEPLLDQIRRGLEGDLHRNGSQNRPYTRDANGNLLSDKNRSDRLARHMAASEQAPGIPNLDADHRKANNIPVADRETLKENANKIPGMQSGKLLDANGKPVTGAQSQQQTQSMFDRFNSDASRPINDPKLTNAGVNKMDQVQKDASVSWMGGRYSQNGSGMHVPAGQELQSLVPDGDSQGLENAVKGWAPTAPNTQNPIFAPSVPAVAGGKVPSQLDGGAPVGDTPSSIPGVPLPDAPVGDTPSSIPGVPVSGAPVGDTPVSDAPLPDAPVGGAPVGDTPSSIPGVPVGDTPVSDAPLPDAPVGDTPSSIPGVPVSGVPVSGAPVGDAPVPANSEVPAAPLSADVPMPEGAPIPTNAPAGAQMPTPSMGQPGMPAEASSAIPMPTTFDSQVGQAFSEYGNGVSPNQMNESQMNLAASQMSRPAESMPQNPVIGNQGLMREWAQHRDAGMASVPPGQDPGNMSNWEEGPRRKAQDSIDRMSEYMPMSNSDMNTVLPSSVTQQGAGSSGLRSQAASLAKRAAQDERVQRAAKQQAVRLSEAAIRKLSRRYLG